jgi:hypothetical protein
MIVRFLQVYFVFDDIIRQYNPSENLNNLIIIPLELNCIVIPIIFAYPIRKWINTKINSVSTYLKEYIFIPYFVYFTFVVIDTILTTNIYFWPSGSCLLCKASNYAHEIHLTSGGLFVIMIASIFHYVKYNNEIQ